MILLFVCVEMALVNRGRLSVQRVEEDTWNVIEQLAEKGGWEEGASAPKRAPKGKTVKAGDGPAKGDGGTDKSKDDDEGRASDSKPKATGRKRKIDDDVQTATPAVRRSTRAKKS